MGDPAETRPDESPELPIIQTRITRPVPSTRVRPRRPLPSRPMRITHLHEHLDLAAGGIVRAVLDLSTVVAELGHEVRVITHDDRDVPPEWRTKPAGVRGGAPKVHLIDPPAIRGILFSPAQMKGLTNIIRETDVLHLHGMWNPENLQLARLARKVGTPYVISVHGMLDDWSMAQKPWKKRLYMALGARKMLDRARYVHTTAEGELEQARKHFPRGQGLVVPLVFDLTPYRTLPGPELADEHFGPSGTGDIEPGLPTVLFLSRVHYKKGVDVLIEAMALLKQRGIDARTIIAGTGDEAYLKEMRQLAETKGVAQEMRFVGMVKGDLKVSLYQRADVFALPTSQENFGFVLPEALACKTPAVTTKGVDIWPELVESGGAITVDRTPKAFVDAIHQLLADPDRRETMGEAGRAWVMDYLEPTKIAAKFEELYRRAADERGPGMIKPGGRPEAGGTRGR